MKLCVTKLPSYISILLNSANPFVTGTVMSSGIQNMKFVLSPVPLQTIPEFNVSVDVSVRPSTVKDILALEDLRDLGTYPIFLASATTFSRSVAEARKHSFAAKFVLYANASIIIERFDPSKS